MKILITGGAGYIASHTIIELIADGHTVVAVDNLSNSSRESLNRVEVITKTTIPFYEIDVRNANELDKIFTKHKVEAVIHFAGHKSVSESVANPLEYYDNNLESMIVLLKAMKRHSVSNLVFSSSATVYGDPEELPLKESSRVGVGITNPYGQTKFMIEQILKDFSVANNNFSITILRYFNPVGAHRSGHIGEDPTGIPNNLLPYVAQVAVGKHDFVRVFGKDYDTIDGTGVRDYIHVVDLAKGHVAAINKSKPGLAIYNLATGKGTSVLELIDGFSKAAGKTIPYKVYPRRSGDVASCFASSKKANNELGWHAEKSIDDACVDSWRWQSQNPNGYDVLD
jgi:UDP-glucose 4-epimerase